MGQRRAGGHGEGAVPGFDPPFGADITTQDIRPRTIRVTPTTLVSAAPPTGLHSPLGHLHGHTPAGLGRRVSPRPVVVPFDTKPSCDLLTATRGPSA